MLVSEQQQKQQSSSQTAYDPVDIVQPYQVRTQPSCVASAKQAQTEMADLLFVILLLGIYHWGLIMWGIISSVGMESVIVNIIRIRYGRG